MPAGRTRRTAGGAAGTGVGKACVGGRCSCQCLPSGGHVRARPPLHAPACRLAQHLRPAPHLLGGQQRHAGAAHGARRRQRVVQLAQQRGAQQGEDVGQLRRGLLAGERAEGDEQAARGSREKGGGAGEQGGGSRWAAAPAARWVADAWNKPAGRSSLRRHPAGTRQHPTRACGWRWWSQRWAAGAAGGTAPAAAPHRPAPRTACGWLGWEGGAGGKAVM